MKELSKRKSTDEACYMKKLQFGEANIIVTVSAQ
jgi:hypothetical protein